MQQGHSLKVSCRHKLSLKQFIFMYTPQTIMQTQVYSKILVLKSFSGESFIEETLYNINMRGSHRRLFLGMNYKLACCLLSKTDRKPLYGFLYIIFKCL